jgi:hypothetical protein
MTGAALGVPVDATKERSFGRLLLAVALGHVAALVTFGLAALPLLYLWVLPRPWLSPGPFPTDGVWSTAADIAVAAVIVLVTAWWICTLVERTVRRHVSLAVVALSVTLTAYVPSLLLLSPAFVFVAILSPVATTWVVRRYAIGAAPLPRIPVRICVALGVVGFAVVASYRVYHPLTAGGLWTADFDLTNSAPGNVTILSVDGGLLATAEGRARTLQLPYTLHPFDHVGVDLTGRPCHPYDVVIRYSVLGLTTTQRFRVTQDAPGNGAFTDLPIGAGCGEYPYGP